MNHERILKRKQNLADICQDAEELELQVEYSSSDKNMFSKKNVDSNTIGLHQTMTLSQGKLKNQQKKARAKKLKTLDKACVNGNPVVHHYNSNYSNNNERNAKSQVEEEAPVKQFSDKNGISSTVVEPVKADPGKISSEQVDKALPGLFEAVSQLKPGENGVASIQSYKIDRKRLLVILPESQTLGFEGYVQLRSILGMTEVFGYVLRKEKVTVASVKSHLVFYMESIKGLDLHSKGHDTLVQAGISSSVADQIIEDYENERVSVVEISHDASNLRNVASLSCVESLVGTKFKGKELSKCSELWKQTVDAVPYEVAEKTGVRGFAKVNPEWLQIPKKLVSYFKRHSKMRVMLCGGTGVGKSSLLRYIANSLLSSPAVSEIAMLDLDPGQPELSLPGTLSLTVFGSPLLGPPYAHAHKMQIVSRKQALIGSVSVDSHFERYYAAVGTLLPSIKRLKCPLIVNTAGFVDDVATDLIVDLIRLIEPTHVVNIRTRVPTNNFRFPLTPEHVNTLQRGTKTSPSVSVNFVSMTTFSVPDQFKMRNFHRSNLRDMTLIGYFSSLWKKNGSAPSLSDSLECKWNDFAIFTTGPFQLRSPSDLRNPLVALCRIGDEYVVSHNGFKTLKRYTMWADNCSCFGYGIVLQNDVDSEVLHILTPCSNLKNINAIVSSNILLPIEIAEIFFEDYRRYSMEAQEENRGKGLQVVRKCC